MVQMEFPETVIIKEERVSDYSDNREDPPEEPFHVNVKIENYSSFEEECSITENKPIKQEPDVNIQFDVPIDNECHTCKRYFPDSHTLYKHNLEHYKVKVVKLPVFNCNLCLEIFPEKEELSNHINVEHKVPEIYSYKSGEPATKAQHRCTICEKVMCYKSWYSHMRTVHAEKPEKCEECGEMFKCYSYLRRHKMYVHDMVIPSWRDENQKEVPCDECNKSFRNRSALKTHKKNCHSNKSYECYICKSVLKCKSYLMSHMHRVHYFDGMQHTCSVCGKVYKSPRYLSVHMKKRHSKPTIPILPINS